MPVKEKEKEVVAVKRPHTNEERLQELERRRAETRKGGGDERIEKQHKGGKLTARERVERPCGDCGNAGCYETRYREPQKCA